MTRYLQFLLISLIAFSTITGCTCKNKTEQQVKIRFGVLPVMQALPLYVAQDRGYFKEHGVDVELITFNTAADKDIAMASRSIDGQFADLFTPAVIEGNGQNISIVATNYTTKEDRRMFALLTKPGGKYKTAKDLIGVPIALSSNTVLHYVTETLLGNLGVEKYEMEFLESKNIGMRFQMLISGQVEAATLPEPLVSAALAKGATLIAEDSGLSESQTVLVFSNTFLSANRDAVKKFLFAVQKAQYFINTQPDSSRGYMVQWARLPDPMKDKYPVPTFSNLHTPGTVDVLNVISWLKEKEVIGKDLNYSDLVDEQIL